MQTFPQRVSRKLAIKGKISDNYENEEKKLDFGLQKHAHFRWTTGNTVAFVLFWFEMGYGFRGNYRSVWFQFQMREREKERCEFEMNFKRPFCSCSNLSNDEIIS